MFHFLQNIYVNHVLFFLSQNVRENVGDVSFNTSIQSSAFEDTDSSVVFWNPLQTSFAGQPSSKRCKNPSTHCLLKPQLSAKVESRKEIASTVADHETSDSQENLAGPLTNIGKYDFQCTT